MSDAAQTETPSSPDWRSLPAGEYAIVELLGHCTMLGRVAEVERFGTKLMAIEALFNDQLLPVVYHGGGSIYRFTPVTPEIAWQKQPRQMWHLPAAVQALVPKALLPPPNEASDSEDDHNDNAA